jgi:hypothetical protein
VLYPRTTGDVEDGDIVLVNTQARDLRLGSGGFDIVVVNLTRGLGHAPTGQTHVMSLPYSPVQHAVRFAEEDGLAESDLDGLPVVCCGLHSQIAPVCAALAGLRVAYIQLGGGALPVALSDALVALKVRRLVEVTIAVSPCSDADLQCVTAASALLVAKARGVQAAVCSIGPGVVGTASRYGHGGLAVSDAANAAAALGGRVVIAPRVSLADLRERHRGISHHTRAALDLCLGQVTVPWPAGLDPPPGLRVEITGAADWQQACAGLPLDHMGRKPDDDPWFFAAAHAAGRYARALVSQGDAV